MGVYDNKQFNGIVIYTAANRRSILSLNHYRSYQYEFGRKVSMHPVYKDFKGIGGNPIVLGIVTIRILFSELNLIIVISFSIIPDNTPSILCNK